MLSDEALVQRTLAGGGHHFGTLVKRYSDYLYGFGLRLTGGNSELAKDMSQQSFTRAFQYLKSFDTKHQSSTANTEHRFRNWLTGIAVNTFHDLIKTEQRYAPLEDHLEPSYQPAFADSHAFYDLIRPLNSENRVLFVLRYIYDYTVPEIALQTGISEGTLKSKLSRAMQRLREHHHD
ncbi:MAG: RNA polymerase sigma factor [Gammaproteobacteria bacterium]|nr:RNA polymerase sigma factor [Gammaproteobacteria bacterium]